MPLAITWTNADQIQRRQIASLDQNEFNKLRWTYDRSLPTCGVLREDLKSKIIIFTNLQNKKKNTGNIEKYIE